MNLQGRNLLKETDLTAAEIGYLVDLGGRLRMENRMGLRSSRLAGRNIALIFEKTSTRTRSAFEVAAHDEGAHVAAVKDGYGTPQARPIRRATPAGLRARSFPAGSMGPKIDAVCRFVEATGKLAAIGQLSDAQALLTGDAGTVITG